MRSNVDTGSFDANHTDPEIGIVHFVDVFDCKLVNIEKQDSLVLVLVGEQVLHVELLISHVDMGLLLVEGAGDGQPDVPGIHPIFGVDDHVLAQQEMEEQQLRQIWALFRERGQHPIEVLVQGVRLHPLRACPLRPTDMSVEAEN